MRGFALAVVVCALSGCGDTPDPRPDGGSEVATIVVEPPDVMVTITDGVVVAQDYTATLVEPDGDMHDVTDTAVFSFADASFGTWTGPRANIGGAGAGPTRVVAMAEGASGDTGLTVFVRQTIVDVGVDPSVPEMFESSTEDPTLAPTIAYPLDAILVPPNLGQFDVHWNNNPAATTPPDVFRIRMQNQYVDIKRFTTGIQPSQPNPFWMVFEPEQWYPIASSRQQLTLEVAGMVAADPTRKGTAVSQHVDVTNENAKGGIYYWSTSVPRGIYRYDINRPDVPPEAYFPSGQEPGGSGNCMGCHSLSRDGTKLALTIDGGDGRGTVMNVSDRSILVPYDGSTTPSLYWNFATFTPAADKFVAVKTGQMTLYDTNGGAVITTIPNSVPEKLATHPELSPDGTLLVNVETTSGGVDYSVGDGAIVIRTFDSTTNTFGPPTELVASGADSLQSYYPSFSPDGRWLIMTRTPDGSYNHYNATTWIMPSDGSHAPIQLATSDLSLGMTDSWARWVPFGQTFGSSNEPMFYLTWSSTRPFGVRIPGGGIPQIWMTPVFPDRAEAGMDPSGNAFRVPFQKVDTANHIAQWTEQVVVVNKSATK